MLQEVNSRLEEQRRRCSLQPDSQGRDRHPSEVKNHCLLHKVLSGLIMPVLVSHHHKEDV